MSNVHNMQTAPSSVFDMDTTALITTVQLYIVEYRMTHILSRPLSSELKKKNVFRRMQTIPFGTELMQTFEISRIIRKIISV